MSYKNIALTGMSVVLVTYSSISYSLHHKDVLRSDILRSDTLTVCNDGHCIDLEKSEPLPQGMSDNAPLGIRYALDKKEVNCLAQNIYFEARGESLQGRIKVGLSTVNRVKDNRFPDTICKVVNQSAYVSRFKKTVHQMSWRADKSKHNVTPPKRFIDMAKDILLGKHANVCKSTNWFNPEKSSPARWSASKKKVTVHFNQRMINQNRTTCIEQVGKHVFIAYK